MSDAAPGGRTRPGGDAGRPGVRPRGRHRVATHVVLRADPGPGAARRGELRARGRARRTTRPSTEDAACRAGRSRAARVPSPMADLPAGATFGSLVHGVLELADPEAPDLRAELVARTREQLPWWPVGVDAETIADGAAAVAAHAPRSARVRAPPGRHPAARPAVRARLRVPARPAATAPSGLAPASASATSPGCCAATCPPATRSRRTPTSSSARSATRRCGATCPGRSTWCCACRTAVLTTASPLRRRRLQDQPARRARDAATSADYGRAEMAAAMLHSHYPLQALLYSVVLHRYLRWRLPSYDARAAPRRCPLPLPARHVRPRDAGRRRARRGRLRLVAAGGPGDRPQRPAGGGRR